MMRKLLSFAAVVAAALPPSIWAAGTAVADFARDEDLRGPVKISPDGRYLALVQRKPDGADVLDVLRLSDRKATGGLVLGYDHRVRDFSWAGRTVVVSFGEKYRTLKEPQWTGELLAVDAEGRSPYRYIFGSRGGGLGRIFRVSGRSFYNASHFSVGEVVRDLPGEPSKVLIQSNDYSVETHPNYSELRLVDLRDGSSETLAQAPVRGHTQFLADSAGNPRYAVVQDDELNYRQFIKTDPQGEWQPVNGPEVDSIRVQLDAVSSDDRRAYLRSYEGGNRYCLIEQMLDGSARRKLSCDAELDMSRMILSFDGKEPIAALYDGAAPYERILPGTNPDGQKLAALMQRFPGQVVLPVSSITDGSKVVLLVYSDRSPGDYYLLDSASLRTEPLGSLRPWIDRGQMSAARQVEFRARDGQMIHGLLTVPAGREAKSLPLVVHPHADPFGAPDTARWDEQTQLLASRGYAVLQVNYRGSEGYGRDFALAGRRQLGAVMLDDIVDGTHWVVGQGIADGGRVCIFGTGYGGYAALAGAEREPDLYRCVIGYGGVYDLNQLVSDSRLTHSYPGLSRAAEFIGDDAAQLRKDSPVHDVGRLKAALMIVHGDDDPIAPETQAEALRAALDAHHYPYQWIVKDGEGHGFYVQQDREEFYGRLLAFLDAQIGGRMPAVGAPAVTADAAAAPLRVAAQAP